MSRRSNTRGAAPDVSVDSFEAPRKPLESFDDIETVLSAGEVDAVRLFPVRNGVVTWEIEQELLHAERVISATRALRFDVGPAHDFAALPRNRRRNPLLRAAMWISLIVGVTLVSCAIALLVLDYYANSNNLTSIKMAAPAGGGGLIAAAVMQYLAKNRAKTIATITEGLKAFDGEAPQAAPPPPHFTVSQRYGSQYPFAASAPYNMRNSSDYERLSMLLAEAR